MLKIDRIECSELAIPFNVRFSHAAASRKETQSILVKVTTACGLVGHGEGCPREYVTGESLLSAKGFVSKHREEISTKVRDLVSLKAWVSEHKNIIDAQPAAWCAVEMALLDVIAQREDCCVEALLDIPTHRVSFAYTAVLGNGEISTLRGQAERYIKLGFQDFKVKLSGLLQEDRRKLELIRVDGIRSRVRVDANNLWGKKEDAIQYFQVLSAPIFAIEEPLSVDQHEELKVVARELHTRVILDESFQRQSQLGLIRDEPEFWMLNVRISKMGGLLRSLNVIDNARRYGIPIIIGAHVGETSLSTRASLVAAQAAREALMAQEGAFGTYLLRHDVCNRPLMFGRGGRMEFPYAEVTKNGFGLQIDV